MIFQVKQSAFRINFEKRKLLTMVKISMVHASNLVIVVDLSHKSLRDIIQFDIELYTFSLHLIKRNGGASRDKHNRFVEDPDLGQLVKMTSSSIRSSWVFHG